MGAQARFKQIKFMQLIFVIGKHSPRAAGSLVMLVQLCCVRVRDATRRSPRFLANLEQRHVCCYPRLDDARPAALWYRADSIHQPMADSFIHDL